MKIKINRESIHNKFDGKCAYCGSVITLKQMQIDHVIPRSNFYMYMTEPRFANTNKIPDFLKHIPPTDCNHYDNLFPSCASCNNYKSTHSLELFREEIEAQAERILKYFPTARLAQRFGIIEVKKQPVKFYFETLKQ